MMRSAGSLVPRMSLRVDVASSDGVKPARASRGSASSRMRPLARASVSIGSGYPLDSRAEVGEALLDLLVAAIEVVDAVDDRLALGHEPGDDEARRGAQV